MAEEYDAEITFLPTDTPEIYIRTLNPYKKTLSPFSIVTMSQTSELRTFSVTFPPSHSLPRAETGLRPGIV